MFYYPFQDLWLKVLAIGLAVLLWFTVAGGPTNVERGLQVPLEFENIPQGFEVVGDTAISVEVRVRGSSAILSRLESGEVVAVLDLKAARPGSRLFDLVTEQVRAPFGVQVTQVVPATVALNLEPSGRRTVPVVPVVEGEPAPGYIVGQVSSDPSTVEVIGPESRLRQLTEATTEPVLVSGATVPLLEEVTVGVSDSMLRLSVPRRVDVTVDVIPAPTERTFGEVQVRPRNVRIDITARVIPPIVAIRVKGSQDTLQDLSSDAIDAFVDLTGLSFGSYTLPVRGESLLPLGIVEIEPAMVNITLE